MDDDVLFKRGPLFPDILNYASDKGKVLFAVRDFYWLVDRPGARFLRKRILSYKRDFVGPYLGSGLLLFRGGEILQRELRNTIEYFSQHIELKLVEQDALNLAFNWHYIKLLPRRKQLIAAIISIFSG
jgi:hypothetical protein